MTRAINYRRRGEAILAAAVDGLTDDDGLIQDEAMTDGQAAGILTAATYFLAALAADVTQYDQHGNLTDLTDAIPVYNPADDDEAAPLADDPTVPLPTNDAAPEPPSDAERARVADAIQTADPDACVLAEDLATCLRDDHHHTGRHAS